MLQKQGFFSTLFLYRTQVIPNLKSAFKLFLLKVYGALTEYESEGESRYDN